jgi:cytochrome c peroxidase
VRACANDRVVISAALKEQYKRPDKIPFPKENPYSKAKESLGKILFFEPRISRSGVMSCATCHNPGFGWTDSNPKGVGDFHKILPRKDPTILNLAWDKLFFWDGRAEGLEMQALMPIQADGEMHISADDMTQRLKSINEYAQLFKKAFPEDPDPIRSENVARALATFERTVISGIAPFDLWIQGDKTAIPESAKRGFLIFNKKAQCAACHSGWNFSDGSFHDIGIDDDDIGRGKWLSLSVMQHAFKTVGLREIERRAPYMHNGSLPSLLDVVNHYDHGFVARESLAGEVKPLHLTEQEKTDLVAFLKTLTSHNEPVIIPQLPR